MMPLLDRSLEFDVTFHPEVECGVVFVSLIQRHEHGDLFGCGPPVLNGAWTGEQILSSPLVTMLGVELESRGIRTNQRLLDDQFLLAFPLLALDETRQGNAEYPAALVEIGDRRHVARSFVQNQGTRRQTQQEGEGRIEGRGPS